MLGTFEYGLIMVYVYVHTHTLWSILTDTNVNFSTGFGDQVSVR